MDAPRADTVRATARDRVKTTWWGQVATTGNIRVVVTDQVGLSIPGATVTASAEDTATTRVGH